MTSILRRGRRLRSNHAMRSLVRENSVSKDDLIFPMFVTEYSQSSEISSMPGVMRYTLADVSLAVETVANAGLKAIMLFGIPLSKNPMGTEAYSPTGVIPEAIRLIKRAVGDSLLVIPDVCLCEYTSHGHCGVVENGTVLNDPTLELLARAAVCYVEAGADMIAPSDMMDGRISHIRKELDSHSMEEVPIFAYSAKYASGFYGPFRDAADSTPQFGDRRSYQMDSPNRREAMREIALDIDEGADIIMVKPGLSYLDIVRDARERFDIPLAVYNVSGEYSMVKAAAQNGWIDEARVVDEILVSFKRAGADLILTYHALEWAKRKMSY